MGILLKISVKEALERTSVTGFVLCHFMYGVVDGVEVVGLCHLRKIHLAGASAVLRGNAGFQILLGGVGEAFAQHLGKLRRMLRFLINAEPFARFSF